MVVLAVLAIIPYIPFLSLPFISDDYLQVYLGRQYGPVSGWAALAWDPLYRCRATSLVLTYWTERWFGLSPVAFYSTTLVLHVLNTWLVFALGSWRRIGWKLSALAAAFFAVYDGHQEAVVWYSACHDLLVFFFGLAAVLLWVQWLQADSGPGRRVFYAAAVAAFIVALFSKESAVALVPVLGLLAWTEAGWRKALKASLAPAMLAAAYTVSIFLQQAGHLHFHDGTFSLLGPVWLTLPNSFARMFWIWGVAGLAAVHACGDWERWLPVVRAAAVWMALTLLPYSFLTYMPRVPSRHTYLASAAIGMIVAAGGISFAERIRSRARWAPALVACLVLVHECGYLWTRKYAQFVERAAPTEELIRYARSASGSLRVYHFPYGATLARLAVEVGMDRHDLTVIDADTPDQAFCYDCPQKGTN